MKIQGSDLQAKLSVYQSTQVQTKPQPSEDVKTEQQTTPAVQQDRVALSSQGRSIAEAQRAAADVPDVRETLVSQIRSEIENGTYTVDNQKAAEGILKESLVNEAALA